MLMVQDNGPFLRNDPKGDDFNFYAHSTDLAAHLNVQLWKFGFVTGCNSNNEIDRASVIAETYHTDIIHDRACQGTLGEIALSTLLQCSNDFIASA